MGGKEGCLEWEWRQEWVLLVVVSAAVVAKQSAAAVEDGATDADADAVIAVVVNAVAVCVNAADATVVDMAAVVPAAAVEESMGYPGSREPSPAMLLGGLTKMVVEFQTIEKHQWSHEAQCIATMVMTNELKAWYRTLR